MQRKYLTFLRQMVYKELMTDKLPKCVPNHYFLEMLKLRTHTYKNVLTKNSNIL